MKRIIIIIAVTITLLLTSDLLSPSQLDAQSLTWSEPVIMGETWYPDIATDSTGTVYLAWAGGDSNYDLVMFATNNGDGRWSEPNDIKALPAPSGRYATRPSLLTDSNGVLHLGYRGDTIWYSHVPLAQSLDAQAWSNPMSVVSAGYFSKVVNDLDGTLHFFFTENKVSVECTNCFHLIYQQATDGEHWSSPLDITPALDGTAKPQIVIDNLNNIHVVFEAGYGGDLGQLSDPTTVMYMASYDGGTTWTNPRRLSPERGDNPAAQARNVAIGIDGEQRLIAVWWAIPEDIVYYQISQDQGQTWAEPIPIPGVAGIRSVYQSRLDIYSLATDSAGHVHLVMSGRRSPDDSSVSLMHLVWDGSGWSPPEEIVRYDGDIPEWPRIAIGNGNQLHVAWFVRDMANLFTPDTTNYRVWYAHGTSSAPYAAPVAIPLPTPTPSLGNVIPNQATHIITDSVVSLDEALKQPSTYIASLDNLMTENDDIRLLFVGILPAILLIALATIVSKARRQI